MTLTLWIIICPVIAIVIAFVKIFAQNKRISQLEKKLGNLQQQLAEVMAQIYLANSEQPPTEQATIPKTTTLSETILPVAEADNSDLSHPSVTPVDQSPMDSLSDIHEQNVQYPYNMQAYSTDSVTSQSKHSTQSPNHDESAINIVTSLWQSARQWFFGENLVVRVGALVLLVGVVLLLKLASQYIHVSMPVRMALVAMGGLVLTIIGYKTTAKKRSYGLTLQGAGFAVIYLTVFASFKLYGLLPSSITFGVLAILAGLTVMFSVWQNALPLAVLAFGGAFLAPILVSRPDGSVVMLFSYYLLLNVAVAVIAHYRTWKLLNALSLAVTFGLAYVWGFGQFQAAHTDGASVWTSVRWQLLALLVAHMALYIFIAVRYSQQVVLYNQQLTNQSYQAKSIVSIDSGLLFGTALLGFGLMASLLNDLPYHLAFASSILSAIYLGLGMWLLKHYRRSIVHDETASSQFNNSFQLLIEASLALGCGFLALVIPLALSGQWLTIGWAVQGVGLVWLGQRTYRQWSVWFGLLLQALSVVLLVNYQGIMANWHELLDSLSIVHKASIAEFAISLPLAVLTIAVMLSAFMLRNGLTGKLVKGVLIDEAMMTTATNPSQSKTDNRMLQSTVSVHKPSNTGLGYVLVVVGVGLYVATLVNANFFVYQSDGVLSIKLAIGLAAFLLVGQLLHARFHWYSLRQISRFILPVAMMMWLSVWSAWFEVKLTSSEDSTQIIVGEGLYQSILAMFVCLGIAKLLGIWMLSRWYQEGVRTHIDQLFWLLALLAMSGIMIDALPFEVLHHSMEWQAIAEILPVVLSMLVLIGLSYQIPASRGNSALAIAKPTIWVARLQKWLYWLDPVSLLKNSAYVLVPMTALWLVLCNYNLDGAALGFYLPILNPLDLTMIGILLYQSYLAIEFKKNQQKIMAGIVAALAFVTVSSMLVRGFASFLGTPIWSNGAWSVSIVQTGLTILWTMIAMALMFVANKKAIRIVWFVGMSLLTIVVAKLILIDMSNTSAILRVVSFIGAGVLMLVIGYLAPLPPKTTKNLNNNKDMAN